MLLYNLLSDFLTKNVLYVSIILLLYLIWTISHVPSIQSGNTAATPPAEEDGLTIESPLLTPTEDAYDDVPFDIRVLFVSMQTPLHLRTSTNTRICDFIGSHMGEYSARNQRVVLIFGGRQLDHSQTFRYYRILDSVTVHCLLQDAPQVREESSRPRLRRGRLSPQFHFNMLNITMVVTGLMICSMWHYFWTTSAASFMFLRLIGLFICTCFYIFILFSLFG